MWITPYSKTQLTEDTRLYDNREHKLTKFTLKTPDIQL